MTATSPNTSPNRLTRQQLELINRKTIRYPLQIAEKDYFLALAVQPINFKLLLKISTSSSTIFTFLDILIYSHQIQINLVGQHLYCWGNSEIAVQFIIIICSIRKVICHVRYAKTLPI